MAGTFAYVHCRCLIDGRAGPLPAGVEAWVDDCGEIRPVADDGETWQRFELWEDSNPCPHPGFKVAEERMGTWELGLLRRELLERRGDFPVLAEYLPGEDWECLPANRLPEARAELDRFRTVVPLTQSKTLVDSRTGTVISEANPYTGQVIAIGPFEVEGTQFVVSPSDPAGPKFRAARVEQQIIGLKPSTRLRSLVRSMIHRRTIGPTSWLVHSPEIFQEKPRFRFRGLDGSQEEVEHGIYHWLWTDGDRFDHYPARFHVEVAMRQPSAFADELSALERVFSIGIELDSPVDWFR